MEISGALGGAEARFVRAESLREADRGGSGIGGIAVERCGNTARAVRVVEGELTLDARTEHRHVGRLRRTGRLDDGAEVEERADEHNIATRGGGEQQARAVRRRQDDRACSRLENSRGELPKSKPSMRVVPRSPASTASPSAVATARASSTSEQQRTRE